VRLNTASPILEEILARSMIHTLAQFSVPEIKCETIMVLDCERPDPGNPSPIQYIDTRAAKNLS
jgi:hypothetical protein